MDNPLFPRFRNAKPSKEAQSHWRCRPQTSSKGRKWRRERWYLEQNCWQRERWQLGLQSAFWQQRRVRIQLVWRCGCREQGEPGVQSVQASGTSSRMQNESRCMQHSHRACNDTTRRGWRDAEGDASWLVCAAIADVPETVACYAALHLPADKQDAVLSDIKSCEAPFRVRVSLLLQADDSAQLRAEVGQGSVLFVLSAPDSMCSRVLKWRSQTAFGWRSRSKSSRSSKKSLLARSCRNTTPLTSNRSVFAFAALH